MIRVAIGVILEPKRLFWFVGGAVMGNEFDLIDAFVEWTYQRLWSTVNNAVPLFSE